jgi:hypothetical protein
LASGNESLREYICYPQEPELDNELLGLEDLLLVELAVGLEE